MYRYVFCIILASCCYPGQPGRDGVDGQNAINGTNGIDGLNGSNGTDGTSGTNGIDGINGSNGLNGSNGANGQDAAPVTFVQLCPGVSTHAVFVEVGLCLQGRLYGVYSANGGFMTYLADGAYSSNAIGSACNLTITGCVVSH